jgi:DNA-binding NtrC family response regulator
MKRILAVSNDEQLLTLLDNKLSDLGFAMETMEAQDDLLEKIKAEKPGILLIDFLLGDENAAAVCHQVTSDPDMRDVPVIILSDFPGIDELAAKLGSFAVIKKPMDSTGLTDKIIEALLLKHPA